MRCKACNSLLCDRDIALGEDICLKCLGISMSSAYTRNKILDNVEQDSLNEFSEYVDTDNSEIIYDD